jgi:hypothetical protein
LLGRHACLAEVALLPEFPDEVSERQLKLAINWGRYAEIIDYDDSDETVRLAIAENNAEPHSG